MADELQAFALASSWLTGGDYDPGTQTLTVYTRDGRDYTHPGIDPQTVAAFRAAPSAGAFYYSQIKGR